jgi:hypothetical protein
MLSGRNTTEQLVDADAGAPNVQVLALKLAVPPGELGLAIQLTDPVGASPPVVSVRVIVQVALWPTYNAPGCPW